MDDRTSTCLWAAGLARPSASAAVLAANLASEHADAQGWSQSVTEAEFNVASKPANPRASVAINGYTIANEAVNSEKIARGLISGDLADSSVTNPKLDAGAVSTAKLGAGAVTDEKIGDDAVTQSKLADRAVGPGRLDARMAGSFPFGGSEMLGDNVARCSLDSPGGGGTCEITAAVAFRSNANGYRELAIRHTTQAEDADQVVSRVAPATGTGNPGTFLNGTASSPRSRVTAVPYLVCSGMAGGGTPTSPDSTSPASVRRQPDAKGVGGAIGGSARARGRGAD